MNPRRSMRPSATLAIVGILMAGAGVVRADDRALVEAFEREVRPILVKRCVGCHGPEKQKGGLRLDSRAAAIEGGGTGPALMPGNPGESLIIGAVNYSDDLQMPPKSKLPKAEIDTLTNWVESGAVWPGGDGGKRATVVFDLAARAKHWSFRPVQKVDPPAVRNWNKIASPIDRFLLRDLEVAGLSFAAEADRPTLIRRLTFDLVGLPPTPEEIDAFVGDARPDAYERLVERLLASPLYGERWGRHWLDVVRFAETAGHEFDYDIPQAWRYRDYVVRALNDDIPYDRFAIEQVAGDLLPDPRFNRLDGSNESIQGTGFYHLVEGTHSPVDVREEQIRRSDNQIDVLAKAFLGLTVSCARCHDHKFDPITQKDYYALAGIIESSRHQYASIEPTGPRAERIEGLLALTRKPMTPDEARLAVALKGADGESVGKVSGTGESVFEDFDGEGFHGWTVSGEAFGERPTRPGDGRRERDRVIALPGGWAHSARASERLIGVLRSKTFRIERPYLLVRAMGRGGVINVVVDGFEKIRSPIYGGLTRRVDSPEAPQWVALDVAMWRGQDAYLEIADGGVADFQSANAMMVGGDGWIAVDEIRMADSPTPEGGESTTFPAGFARRGDETPEVWGRRIAQGLIAEKVDPALWNWAAARGLLSASLDAAQITRAKALEGELATPRLALAMVDGTGRDAALLIRGQPKTPGPLVPRRFLEVLQKPGSSEVATGSGRLDLARKIVDADNPLFARVIVNRVWKGHFGEGLVRSVDDFGLMGELPSHPELLDWLAARFVEDGYSIKGLHRLLVCSTAYRMSSTRIDLKSEAADPTNRLLHRANLRRLEAEAIRDSILSASGRLDLRIGGPGVAPHLTEFMEGRGRPGRSGPIDGAGRRTLYLNVRRNFLSPFLLVFDFPPPATTMGRRNTSNVPAQALTLLNDPFVGAEAQRWADRERSREGTESGKITHAYRVAFGRPPTRRELEAATGFLDEVRKEKGEASAWAELCHSLLNVKSFVFVE